MRSYKIGRWPHNTQNGYTKDGFAQNSKMNMIKTNYKFVKDVAQLLQARLHPSYAQTCIFFETTQSQ